MSIKSQISKKKNPFSFNQKRNKGHLFIIVQAKDPEGVQFACSKGDLRQF